jgi:hypothetical protein
VPDPRPRRLDPDENTDATLGCLLLGAALLLDALGLWQTFLRFSKPYEPGCHRATWWFWLAAGIALSAVAVRRVLLARRLRFRLEVSDFPLPKGREIGVLLLLPREPLALVELALVRSTTWHETDRTEFSHDSKAYPALPWAGDPAAPAELRGPVTVPEEEPGSTDETRRPRWNEPERASTTRWAFALSAKTARGRAVTRAFTVHVGPPVTA